MILFLVIGGMKCFGVFYVEVARQYHVSSKEIQLIQSLTGFFYLGLGKMMDTAWLPLHKIHQNTSYLLLPRTGS
jgi:hypothetical protein